MRYIQNERGIALVMVLIFSLIGLAIVSAMLFMVTQGTQMSGSNRVFRSAEEAGLGGVNVAVDMVKNRGVASLGLLPNAIKAGLNTNLLADDPCLGDKLTISREQPTAPDLSRWLNCNAKNLTAHPPIDRLSLDPTISPDITRDLNGPPGTNFKVYAKIVDTVQGNTDPHGLVPSGELWRAGVVDAKGGGQVSPKPVPFMYRIEVQTQNTTNPTDVSRYSVLYAY